MIHVNDDIREAYRTDSITKSYFVIFRDLGIVKTNSDIISESLVISESIGSSDMFEMGLCEANSARLSMYLDTNVAGDEMTLIEVFGDYEPEISVDETKGIVFSDSSMEVLYEGALSNIGSDSIKFDDTKYYMLIGKMLYTNEDTYVWISMDNDTKKTIYYIPNNVFEDVESQYINICIPFIGSEFSEYILKFTSNITITGYFTLYEINHPIMPLGVYMIDSAKKDHDDASIRILQGYDKMNLAKLDEDYILNLTESTVDVNDLMENVIDGTPIQLGRNLSTDDLSRNSLSLEVLRTENISVYLPDNNKHLVYRAKKGQSEFTGSFYGSISYYDSFNNPDYISAFYQSYTGYKNTGKLTPVHKSDGNTYIANTYTYVFAPSIRPSGVTVSTRLSLLDVHYIPVPVKEIDVNRKREIVDIIDRIQITINNPRVHIEYEDMVDYVNVAFYMETQDVSGKNYYVIFKWDSDEVSILRDIVKLPYAEYVFTRFRMTRPYEYNVNDVYDYANKYDYVVDVIFDNFWCNFVSLPIMESKTDTQGIEDAVKRGFNCNVLKFYYSGGIFSGMPSSIYSENTYSYGYLQRVIRGNDFTLDIPNRATEVDAKGYTADKLLGDDSYIIVYPGIEYDIYSQVTNRKIQRYLSGSIRLDYGAKSKVTPHTSSWYVSDMIRTDITYQIKNYDSTIPYKFRLHSPNSFGISKNIDVDLRDYALAMGDLVIDWSDSVKQTINRNTSTSIELDNEGKFSISYISKLNYWEERFTDVPFEDKEPIPSDASGTFVSYRTVLGAVEEIRLQGSLPWMDLPVSNPLIQSTRRFIISSYLETTGNFLNFNRLGVSNLLAPKETFNGQEFNFTIDNMLVTDSKSSKHNLLSETTMNGYTKVRLDEMEMISSETNMYPGISDVPYTQSHIYSPDIDLELIDSESEIIEFEDPIYGIEGKNLYATLTMRTSTYRIPISTGFESDNWHFNVLTDMENILEFDSDIKSQIESEGELIIDNQYIVLQALSEADENFECTGIYKNTDIIEYNVTVKYVYELRYSSSDKNDIYTANNLLHNVIGFEHFNDKAIFVIDGERYYPKIYITNSTYTYTLPNDTEYVLSIEGEVDKPIATLASIHEEIQQHGEFLIDRLDYITNLIGSIVEYSAHTESDNTIVINLQYISRLTMESYTGIYNSEDNKSMDVSVTIENPFRYMLYKGEVDSKATFAKDYVHYFIDITNMFATYKLPTSKIGDIFDINYIAKQTYIQNILDACDSIESTVLTDSGGDLEVNRVDEYKSAILNYINENFEDVYYADTSKIENGYITVGYISEITCIKQVRLQDSVLQSIVNYPLSVDMTSSNAEPIEDYLTRQLYIEDHINAPYTGVCILKYNATGEESTLYPYYYNLDGSKVYNKDVHYYVVKDNFFIDNFILTDAQLGDICEDMLKTLKNFDSYNLDATYKALPYTEVCDKVCIEGVNHIPGQRNDLYYTVILSKTLRGNLAMTDKLETEFEYD